MTYRRWSMAPLLLCVAALFLLSATACSPWNVRSSNDGVVTGKPDRPVIIVHGLDMPEEYSSPMVYWRAAQLVDILAERTNMAIVAPWELEMLTGEPWPEGPAQLSRLVSDNGLDPEQVVVLRLVVRETSLDGGQRYDPAYAGTQRRMRSADVEISATMESLVGRRYLASAEVSYRDPEGVVSDEAVDPRPLFTEAMERLGSRVARELLRVFPDAPGVQGSGIETVRGLEGMFRFEYRNSPPLLADLDRLPEVEARALRYRWYRRIAPDLATEELDRLDRAQRGLLVLDPGPHASGVLQVGDIILRADGLRVRSEPALERAFPVGRSTHVVLLVDRGGEEIELRVPPR